MRRPVGVKTVLSLSLWILTLTEPPLSPSFHPQSLLSDFRSLPVGVLDSVGASTFLWKELAAFLKHR